MVLTAVAPTVVVMVLAAVAPTVMAAVLAAVAPTVVVARRMLAVIVARLELAVIVARLNNLAVIVARRIIGTAARLSERCARKRQRDGACAGRHDSRDSLIHPCLLLGRVLEPRLAQRGSDSQEDIGLRTPRL
jgi:hypothetical protein